ncbi:BnaA02g06080D [Brassica napus]|uniref:BnaA02g06080D protein n=1 Tax=Brassica napus TaxID=3708 RepID=A0A078F7V1_BRANA|nr:BnaA02g06080D [Brassica napus]
MIENIEKEERTVQKAIKEAAKRNDMVSAKALAKEIVSSRRTVNKLYENKAHMNSISMHLGESIAVAGTVGNLSKSTEVMKLVNDLMKAPQMAAIMQEFGKEMTKAGVIEEFVSDAIDDALDSEGMEEEIDEEVDKLLTAIAGETAAELPEAVRKERIKVPAQKASTALEEEAIAGGVDDEEEVEEIQLGSLNQALRNLSNGLHDYIILFVLKILVDLENLTIIFFLIFHIPNLGNISSQLIFENSYKISRNILEMYLSFIF